MPKLLSNKTGYRGMVHSMNTGYVWHGHFDRPIGYGEEARQFVLALRKSKIPVIPRIIEFHGENVEKDDGRAAALTEEFFSALPGGRAEVAMDSYVSVSHSIPSLVLHDPKASMNVVRCMYETDRFPADWVSNCMQLDGVWVPSDFNWVSFSQSGIPEKKLFKLPGSIDTDFYSPEGPATEIVDAKRFKFFSLFEWSLRKGWDILIEAFLEEFSPGEPVLLIIKTWTTLGIDYKAELQEKLDSLGRNDPPIVLFDAACLGKLMPMLYRAMDCFVLPSHGEGWGRPYMEAMSCGLPTIGTGWSGNTEFMNRENSFLLDYEVVPVDSEIAKELPAFEGHRWANPDKQQLRQFMRHVFANPTKAKEVGLRARRDMEQKFSHPPIAKLLKDKLDSLVKA